MPRSFQIVTVVLLTVGAVLLVTGILTPAYTHPVALNDVIMNACENSRPVEGWREPLDAIETNRFPFIYGGAELVLATLAALFLWVSFADKTSRQLQTPSSKAPFFALGLASIALSWFAQMVSLTLDQGNHHFPWCADTIIIPVMNITAVCIVMAAACLCIGALCAVNFKTLPQSLFCWRADQPVKSWNLTIAFGAVAAIILFLWFGSLAKSDFLDAPAAIVSLYLCAATRSALLGECTKDAQ